MGWITSTENREFEEALVKHRDILRELQQYVDDLPPQQYRAELPEGLRRKAREASDVLDEKYKALISLVDREDEEFSKNR